MIAIVYLVRIVSALWRGGFIFGLARFLPGATGYGGAYLL
jgi:hypothetical protein